MKDYKVEFAYFSKVDIAFKNKEYIVQAENQFEANNKAWELTKKDKELSKVENLKQIGTMWKGTPDNLQDYLNSHAEEAKFSINNINEIGMKQSDLKNDNTSNKLFTTVKNVAIGMKSEATILAKDFGLIPPDIYKEIHYGKILIEQLKINNNEKTATALEEVIEKATNWNKGSMLQIENLFKIGTFYGNNEEFNVKSYFNENSVFPEHSRFKDFNAWTAIRFHSLQDLPIFKVKDVNLIKPNTNLINKLVVLDSNILKPKKIKPENLLWLYKSEENNMIYLKNPITNDKIKLNKNNILGELKAEIAQNINFSHMSKEYNINKIETEEVER